MSRLAAAALTLALCAGGAMAQNNQGNGNGQGNNGDDTPNSNAIHHETNPYDAGFGAPTAGSTGSITPVITYHGGGVMATPTVYLIWYGNWNQSNGSDTPAGQQIVRDFFHTIGGSSYYRINSSYSGVTGNVTFGGEYTDSYSQTARLSDNKIQTIVTNAISKGFHTADVNGIYFVLTSSDVSESSGFCSQYCGWHTAGTISGTRIKYAFVGNANRCLSGCAAQTVGPNGNAGVDGMISVLAHELEEANTDPYPTSGWADSSGAENGDKCAWTFGASLKQTATGAYYNVTLPGNSGGASRNYLIQRDLDSSSHCYVNWDTKAQ